MRRSSRRLAAGSSLLLALAGLSCWYSTNPPAPTGPGSDDDASAAVVTGTVRLFDLTDHHSRNASGWWVRALWYIPGPAEEPLRLVYVDQTTSDGGGTYELRYSNPNVVAVDLQPRICVVDVEGMECCLDEKPCTGPQCAGIWGASVRVSIAPGVRDQRTLTVPCQHVP